jgi:hypothetical protein
MVDCNFREGRMSVASSSRMKLRKFTSISKFDFSSGSKSESSLAEDRMNKTMIKVPIGMLTE